jgi:hypothetical protein
MWSSVNGMWANTCWGFIFLAIAAGTPIVTGVSPQYRVKFRIFALLKLSPRLLAVQRIDDAANQIGVEQPFGGEFAAQRTQAL